MIKRNHVRSILRMMRSEHQIYFLDGYSLFDAYSDLRHGGYREEYRFFVGLISKMPLVQGVPRNIYERFLGCESLSPLGEDGTPLMLCAISGWILISFPSHPDWDRKTLKVRFLELRSNGALEETSDDIDNIARLDHAAEIATRRRLQSLSESDPLRLWDNRDAIFPNLVFGPGTEENLRSAASLFGVIVRKLVLIDESAEEWREAGGPAPKWKTKVTREGSNVRRNPKLIGKRKFPSVSGGTRIFEWHARYGDHGRIHLRFNAASREIEIGYIGPHLPL